MPIFLKNSREVRAKLRELFSPSNKRRRRVACVAYIGADAPSLLPNYDGVEIYCWPQPGATDPRALSQLVKLGATIRLVDRLHSKLYWVKNVGCIVTSANLSKNALGEAGLHEVGIYTEDINEREIDFLLQQYTSRPLTLQELAQLFREHDRFWAGRRPKFQKGKRKALSFLEWFEGDRLPAWKLAWWDTEKAAAAKSTTDAVLADYGAADFSDYMDCRAGQIEPGDWLLTYLVNSKGSTRHIDWMYAERVYKLSRSEAFENGGYDCQAVEVSEPRFPMRPPFDIKERGFPAAFRSVVADFRLDQFKEPKDLSPSREFLLALKLALKP